MAAARGLRTPGIPDLFRVAPLLALAFFLANPARLLALDADRHGEAPSLVMATPFALLLLGIGLFPILATRWWHHDLNKALFALVLSVPVILSAPWGGTLHALLEYLAFMALVGSLFVVSGNIHLEGTWPGTPLANTALLGIGAVLANLLGTTGASMLVVRVLLGTNRARRHRVHLVVFFIFIVSNTAGLLHRLATRPCFWVSSMASPSNGPWAWPRSGSLSTGCSSPPSGSWTAGYSRRSPNRLVPKTGQHRPSHPPCLSRAATTSCSSWESSGRCC